MSEKTKVKEESKASIVFLQDFLQNDIDDEYFVDLAVALQEEGHSVTFYSSDDKIPYEELNKAELGIKFVKHVSTWLPNSCTWGFLKSLSIAWDLYWNSPKNGPQLVVLNANPIAIPILSLIGRLKTIYFPNLSSIKNTNYSKDMTMELNLLFKLFLYFAERVIVQSNCLAKILERSYPEIENKICIVYPALDNGRLNHQTISIYNDALSLLPKEKKFVLFLCFGKYKKSSNFHEVLKGFEKLLKTVDDKVDEHYKDTLRLMFVVDYDEGDYGQVLYYAKFIKLVLDKRMEMRVYFANNISKIAKKILIQHSLLALFPTEHDPFPTDILECLYLHMPIVATYTGFAKEALELHRSAIFVRPSSDLFEKGMRKVLTSSGTAHFLRSIGEFVFNRRFANKVFNYTVINLVNDCLQ